MTRIYIVDDGQVFYGTFEQFQDVFLWDDNCDELAMKDFCDKHDMSFVVIDGDILDFKSMTIEEGNDAILKQINS